MGKGCLIIVGVLFVLGVIGAIIGGGGGSQETTSSAPTAASGNPQVASESTDAPAAPEPTDAPAAPEPTAAPVAATVGQDVQVDEVRWKILEATDLGQTLESDNEYIQDQTTSGRFIRLRFEIENLSKDLQSFAGLDLQDDQGRSFKRSSDVLAFIPNEETCILTNLNPNVTETCTAIYEVPQNAARLQAVAGDLKLFGGQSTLIDLGLE